MTRPLYGPEGTVIPGGATAWHEAEADGVPKHRMPDVDQDPDGGFRLRTSPGSGVVSLLTAPLVQLADDVSDGLLALIAAVQGKRAYSPTSRKITLVDETFLTSDTGAYSYTSWFNTDKVSSLGIFIANLGANPLVNSGGQAASEKDGGGIQGALGAVACAIAAGTAAYHDRLFNNGVATNENTMVNPVAYRSARVAVNDQAGNQTTVRIVVLGQVQGGA